MSLFVYNQAAPARPPEMPAFIRNAMGGQLTARSMLLKMIAGDGVRDLDKECGYPSHIPPQLYRQMYDRNGVAARVVEVLPEECWSVTPDLYEDEDEGVETEFEAAFEDLCKRVSFWHFMERIDILSGIGSYGLLLYVLDDGADLSMPAAGMDPETGKRTGGSHKLLGLQAYDESQAQIAAWCTDRKSIRYGQPEAYNIQLVDTSTVPQGQTIQQQATVRVHWTRVRHVCDNRRTNEIFGTPRQQKPFNYLLDIMKIGGSSAEMFFKGGFPGYSFEVNPELQNDAVLDPDAMREEFYRYSEGLQRYLALTGVSAKSLAVQVADPASHLDSQLKLVALTIGVPWRVFVGSEAAQLASAMDQQTWNKRLARRQNRYLTPLLLTPVVEDLTGLGCLPEPEEVCMQWPDLNTPDDSGKADVALKMTQAMAAYVAGNVQTIHPPMQYLTQTIGMSREAAEENVEAALSHIEALDVHPDEAGGTDQPDAGLAIGGSQKELAQQEADREMKAEQFAAAQTGKAGQPQPAKLGGKTPTKPAKVKAKAK